MARCSSHAKRFTRFNQLQLIRTRATCSFHYIFFSFSHSHRIIGCVINGLYVREKYVQKTSWLDAIDLVEATLLAFLHSTTSPFSLLPHGDDIFIARVKLTALLEMSIKTELNVIKHSYEYHNIRIR